MSRIVSLLFVLTSFSVITVGAEDDGEKAVLERARALVAQLGDDEFVEREKATDELIGMGLAALPALKEGHTHNDREVRYRCRRIDAVVRQNDFQRRLEAFASNKDEDESYDLPGWDRFLELFGNGAEARALFVEIQKEESDALKSFREGPKAVASTLEIRSQQLMQGLRVFRNLD